jgi:hypothetical protein
MDRMHRAIAHPELLVRSCLIDHGSILVCDGRLFWLLQAGRPFWSLQF